MFYSNTLNLIQVGGGTQVKQGDLGSKFSYKLANEKDQELDDFDKEVAHIDLVLNDKIVFTTTATVDNSTVTFNIDQTLPVGLYFLEIKIRDYIFPSDKQTIIFVQSGGVAYDLKELVPNYDVNMTLKGILSDLSQKGIDITDLKTKLAQTVSKGEGGVITPAMLSQETKEQMTGGSVAVVGIDSVLTKNIVDKQVTPEKTTFINNKLNFTLERGTISGGVNDDTISERRVRSTSIVKHTAGIYIVRKDANYLIGAETYENGVFDGIDRGWIDRDVIDLQGKNEVRINVRRRDDTAIADNELATIAAGIEIKHNFQSANAKDVERAVQDITDIKGSIAQTISLKSEEFEIGAISENIPVPNTARARMKNMLRVSKGDVIKFQKDPNIFNYGISISDLNGVWRGVDYGWLNKPEFIIEEDSLIKLVARYVDNRDLDENTLKTLTENTFTIVRPLKSYIDNKLNTITLTSEAMKKDITDIKESIEQTISLKSEEFEIGTIDKNIPVPNTKRARMKNMLRVSKGDIVKFQKDPDIFNYGISISDLNGVWRGVDYGWLNKPEFIIEEDSLIKLVARYVDNRDLDENTLKTLTENTFTIASPLKSYVDNKLNTTINTIKKNTAIGSISVEHGRINGASYVFVRIPKILNDGSRFVPKVALTSRDGSLSGTKRSALNYARDQDTIFTLNAGLFNVKTVEPVGQLIIDGVSLINTPMTSDNGVPIHPDECYPLAIDGNGNLKTYPRNADTAAMIADGVKYAVTAWGKLVDNFKITTKDIDNEIVHPGKYIRQSIGQYQNGDYCVCSVDMTRGPVTNEAGLSYEELAQLFVDRGVKFAYSLDGGGSAETVIGKRQLNPIYEGSAGRAVPTVITFEIVN